MIGLQSLDDYRMLHFGDRKRFRISRRYPSGTRFVRGSVAAKSFVIEGKCRWSFGKLQVDLVEGDYREWPEGRFSFEVLGESDCGTILVSRVPTR